MNILVVGASQGTGALVVKSALGRGHDVTAFARSPERLSFEDAKLRRLKGNFHDAASVSGAIPGHDAVVVTASATSLSGFKENPRYFSQGTEYVIRAMKASGVKRLVVLSALGVGESRAASNWVARTLLVGWLLKAPFEDHERQERMVRESDLDWIIARPGRLTDGPARGRYVKTAAISRVPLAMSRADLADFLVDSCTSNEFVRQAVQLGG